MKRSSSILLIFFFSCFFSFARSETIFLHPNEGEELCFEYTNYDLGQTYLNSQCRIPFPFRNCSGHTIRIESVQCNNPYTANPFRLVHSATTDSVILKDAIDTLWFVRSTYPEMKTMLYDNSWTITFENSQVRQHLNIFVEFINNIGSLSVNPVVVGTVKRGEVARFSAYIKNSGKDPVNVYNDRVSSGEVKVSTPFPISIAPHDSVRVNFSLITDKLANEYSKSIRFETNEDGAYPRIEVPYSGQLISSGNASIKFDSLVMTANRTKGEPLYFEFGFLSNGDQPLVFKNCKTSCGCLVATWPKEPIQPGDRGVIRIKYDTNRVGPINKSCTCTTNTPEERTVLRVKGKVSNPKLGIPGER